jgi:glycosyltransferase involved in cell wall biosynthesis
MDAIRLLELRNTYKWGGGPDKTILLSAERHDPTRVSVVVAYVRDVGDNEFRFSKKARMRGLKFYEICERGKLDLRVLRVIRDIVVRHDINLIHSHDYKSDMFAYLVRRWLWRRHIALMATAHAWVMLGLRGTLYRRLDLFLMRRFDHLIAVSEATKREMTQAGLPASAIDVIHNAIDTQTWSRAHGLVDLRAQLDLGPAFPIVGYVGRLMPEKDLETWLRGAALVAQKYPMARFIFAGEGRDNTTLADLQHLANSLGIRHQVTFLGYREDLLPVYASFDIFALTSRREGLPNSILEAMAMGLPVVTTDVAGTRELVIDGQTGFVIPQGDVLGLAHAIMTLAADEQLRRQMAQAGRHRVEQEFTFATRLRRVETLYEQVLRQKQGITSHSSGAR